MADATREETAKALALWSVAQQGKTPQEWKGFVSKYGIENPFEQWPPTKEKIDAFMRLFQEKVLINTEAKINITSEISAKKLEGLVDEFDREYGKVKNGSDEAKGRAQEFIRRITERTDVAPEQKPLLARETAAIIENEPNVTADRAEAKAVSVLEKAQPFLNEKRYNPRDASFSKLEGLTAVQKGVTAPFLDVITTVFPGLKQGVMNKNFENAFKDLINSTDKLTSLFGSEAVGSSLFQQMIDNAKKSVISGASPGGARTIIDDIASSLFHRAPESSLVTYWELYRINIAQGLPPPSLSQFQASGMGLGSQALHMGTGYVLSRAKGAALKAGLAKLGLEAAIPGAGWAAAAFGLANGLFGKITNWFKGLGGTKPGEVPGDRWILGVGCGAILLIFFILPIVSQEIINSSLVTRLQGIGGGNTGGPSIDCSQTPNDPQCKFTACTGDCQWPASGIITQGPFTGSFCSNPAQTSHDVGNAANGIDIANFDGGPVYTPKAGTVVEVYTSCTNNSGHVGDTCGGSPSYSGYGNHVILKTDDGYTLIFGHMESAMNVTQGQHVDAGTQLGWMDQTGNSTGTHLHFGVLSGGSVLDFVPKGDPAHTPESISGCVDGESSCTKACPYAPVTAGK